MFPAIIMYLHVSADNLMLMHQPGEAAIGTRKKSEYS